MASCVAISITNHLLDNRQCAYRKGKPTEQLWVRPTERWRERVERKLSMGILCVDFTSAFDIVSRNIFLQKMTHLGIRRAISHALKNCLAGRIHFVRINGCDSDTRIITHGVPQGSVIGPTMYCTSETTDLLTNTLNNVVAQLQEWWNRNLMVPHPWKCKAMIMQRNFNWPHPSSASW